jgi:hypothetical protein
MTSRTSWVSAVLVGERQPVMCSACHGSSHAPLNILLGAPRRVASELCNGPSRREVVRVPCGGNANNVL